MLGYQPKPAHAAVRFLATGMMGSSWAEHVALEMAQGEGFVLQAFYAVIDTLDHKPSVDILKRAVKQEERHVEFGEEQTRKAIEGKPWLRRRLLGLSLVSMWGVAKLAGYIHKKLPPDHIVLKHLPAFLAHANTCAEIRLRRIGVLDRPLSEVSGAKRKLLIAEAYGGKFVGGIGSLLGSLVAAPFRVFGLFKRKRVTDTYLLDPHVTGYQLPAPGDARAEAEA
jgi:hypothetical protein